MHLIGSRIIAFLDSQSLAPRQATEAFFVPKRALSSTFPTEHHIPNQRKRLFLETRVALLWLNEDPDDLGSFWHEADEGPEYSQLPT
jgi:hypothetical protein